MIHMKQTALSNKRSKQNTSYKVHWPSVSNPTTMIFMKKDYFILKINQLYHYSENTSFSMNQNSNQILEEKSIG
jgi:hypothetical protein